MKTMKQSIFLIAATLVTTATFAQVRTGITNGAQASVFRSINHTTAARAASHAALVSRSNASAPTTHGAVQKTSTIKTSVKETADVNTNARVKAQASTHASENAKRHANENSAVFGAKAASTVTTDTDVDASVNEKPVTDKTNKKIKKSHLKAEAENNTKAQAKAETKAGVRTTQE